MGFKGTPVPARSRLALPKSSSTPLIVARSQPVSTPLMRAADGVLLDSPDFDFNRKDSGYVPHSRILSAAEVYDLLGKQEQIIGGRTKWADDAGAVIEAASKENSPARRSPNRSPNAPGPLEVAAPPPAQSWAEAAAPPPPPPVRPAASVEDDLREQYERIRDELFLKAEQPAVPPPPAASSPKTVAAVVEAAAQVAAAAPGPPQAPTWMGGLRSYPNAPPPPSRSATAFRSGTPRVGVSTPRSTADTLATPACGNRQRGPPPTGASAATQVGVRSGSAQRRRPLEGSGVSAAASYLQETVASACMRMRSSSSAASLHRQPPSCTTHRPASSTHRPARGATPRGFGAASSPAAFATRRRPEPSGVSSTTDPMAEPWNERLGGAALRALSASPLPESPPREDGPRLWTQWEQERLNGLDPRAKFADTLDRLEKWLHDQRLAELGLDDYDDASHDLPSERFSPVRPPRLPTPSPPHSPRGSPTAEWARTSGGLSKGFASVPRPKPLVPMAHDRTRPRTVEQRPMRFS